MNTPAAPASRLVTVYALAFGAGTVAALVGVVTGEAAWLLAAGPCFMLSGALILVGSRVSFAGPSGAVLRAVLGPARVRGINLRAVVWILVGLALCLWALDSLRRPRDEERWLDDPLVRSPHAPRELVVGRA